MCGADPREGECLGWHGIPARGSDCGGSYPSMCRVCRCLGAAALRRPSPPVPNANGCREQTLFEHTLSDGASHGVITNVWHAGEPGWGAGHLGDPRMRVYVDEEVNASRPWTTRWPSLPLGFMPLCTRTEHMPIVVS